MDIFTVMAKLFKDGTHYLTSRLYFKKNGRMPSTLNV